jgi:phosphoribosylglycinamide formyltransferase 1
MSLPPRQRLVVLISGHGSNLQAVIDACQAGRIPAEVCAVFSNKKESYGLERARQTGIPALFVPKPREQDRGVYDLNLADQVAAYRPDWILLAGWMRILSAPFLDRFPGRVINLHPALPGAFPGTDAIQRALEAFQVGAVQHTGVMVHLVPDEGVDCGPVLGQETVPILVGDTLESLSSRVHAVEHHLLIAVLHEVLAAPTSDAPPYA